MLQVRANEAPPEGVGRDLPKDSEMCLYIYYIYTEHSDILPLPAFLQTQVVVLLETPS